MPLLLQICIVIVTMALVAVAVVMIRAMIRLQAAAEHVTQLCETARELSVKVDRFTTDAQELLGTIRTMTPPIQRMTRQFETLANRAADFAGAALGEVELPVFTAVAVARGVRSGTAYLLERLAQRFIRRRSSQSGGTDHE